MRFAAMRLMAPLALLLVSSVAWPQSFGEVQLRYQRVREAKAASDQVWRERFSSLGMNYPPVGILIRVFKAEQELEVWAKAADGMLVRVHTFGVCASSGTLGPKRRQGDLQVPEGFYHIDRFNPTSAYYLSLGINYPNASDRILTDSRDPGGDIFIHGACVTIGCVPLTDAGIKELYWLAVLARNAGQRQIPVYIFPFRMDDVAWNTAQRLYPGSAHWVFWEALREGYRIVQNNKRLPLVSVDRNGRYVVR
jgi:murein L,D-transpeptidase YafK